MTPAHYLKDEQFVYIHAWMVTDLHLKGNELLLYACIYSFTQSESGCFSGSLQYLAEWCCSSKEAVHRTLKRLVNRNLLERHTETVDGTRRISYAAILPESPTGQPSSQTDCNPEMQAEPAEAFTSDQQRVDPESTGDLISDRQGVDPESTEALISGQWGVDPESTGALISDQRGVDTGSTYNKDNNKENNKRRNKKKTKGGKSAGRFTPPSVEEVRSYCQERNNGINPEAFLDYYTARGWELGHGRKVKDWKACLRTWERNSYGSGYAANDYTIPAGTGVNDPFAWEQHLNGGLS